MPLTDDDKRWIESKLDEKLEHLETKLLTAFHQWSQTYELRARGLAARTNELDERLGLIEERVSKLERMQ